METPGNKPAPESQKGRYMAIKFGGSMPGRNAEKRQEWLCEGCGLNGTVTYNAARGDVFAVLRAIRDHHETLAGKYAPLCHFDMDRVRVRNDELMTVYEWNRLVHKIEANCGRTRSKA